MSEIISVPRYDRANLGQLFYSPVDVARFKREVRMERMRFW